MAGDQRVHLTQSRSPLTQRTPTSTGTWGAPISAAQLGPSASARCDAVRKPESKSATRSECSNRRSRHPPIAGMMRTAGRPITFGRVAATGIPDVPVGGTHITQAVRTIHPSGYGTFDRSGPLGNARTGSPTQRAQRWRSALLDLLGQMALGASWFPSTAIGPRCGVLADSCGWIPASRYVTHECRAASGCADMNSIQVGVVRQIA